MTTIAAGASATITVAPGGQVAVASNGGSWVSVETPVVGPVRTSNHGPTAHTRVFGPYAQGATLVITNQSVNAFNYVDYEVGATTLGTIAVGASTTFTLTPQGTLSVSNPSGYWQVAITPIIGNTTTAVYGPGQGNMGFGPYPAGATIVVTNQSGATLVTSLVSANGGSQSIGGQTIGQPGSGIYSAYTLADGDDFTVLDLVSPANPNGAYFTTRGTYSGGGNMRAPVSGALAPNVYVDPTFTGIADANRGVPLTYDGLGAVSPHSIITGEGTGAIRLISGRQSTAEQAKLGGVNIERTAMLASVGRIVYQWPCVIEARLRYTATGATGWHPSFWNYTCQPAQGPAGSEYGFEGSSTLFTAYEDDHTSGSITVNGGTLALPTGTGHDGNWHTHTVIITANYWSFLIDGVEVNRIGTGINFSGSNASTSGFVPSKYALVDFFMLTNPAYASTFQGEVYSPTSWAAATSGMTCDCEWWRVWYPTSTGRHFTPQVSGLSDQQFTAGQAFSVTLPSATTLWGATPPAAENVVGIQVEAEEPGSSNTTGFSATTGLPTWVTYNSGTRTLSGTIPANSGRVHFKVDPVQSGCTGKPYRFRFDVAPVFVGSATANFTNGSPGSYDLYAAWDCGRLVGTAGNTAGKTLTATGLPTGMTLGANGIISGTPSSTAVFTVTTTATNSAGQPATATITMTVAAAAAAITPPAYTSATRLAYYDPNDSTKLTTSSGAVTNFDPTGATPSAANRMVNAGTSGPVVVSRLDGNNNSKAALQFVTANSNYLGIAGNLGVTGACTVIEVVEMVVNNTTQGHFDISNNGSAFTQNRLTVLNSSTVGANPRKLDSAGTSCSAAVGSLMTTGAKQLHLIVSRFNAGASATVVLNVGTQAAITGSPVSNYPTTLNVTTWGATGEAGSKAKFSSKYSYGLDVLNGYLSDAEITSLLLPWAATNFGTLAS
jgi:hypothetical protein